MSTPVTKQQLVDAGTDAQTLADVMNSQADSVTTRTGATLPTMKKALQLATGPQGDPGTAGAEGPQGVRGLPGPAASDVGTPINIFDYTVAADGAINYTTGAFDASQNWGHATARMDLRGATQWCSNVPIKQYRPSGLGIAYYSSNGTFLSGVGGTDDSGTPWAPGTVFNVPAGGVFMRCFVTGGDVQSAGIADYTLMMILAGPTIPDVYQSFDPDSRYGGGGVLPGFQQTLAFYKHAGATLNSAAITVDPTGVHLTVPGNAASATETLDVTQVQPTGVVSGDFAQRRVTGRIQGPGRSFGNAGGWTVGFSDSTTLEVAQRGIHQLRSGTIQKHAVGDTAGIYQYVKSDGGIQAASDEGVTGVTIEVSENPGCFHGHVATTTGHGDIAPVLAFDSGNGWTTDGAFLLNITKGVYHGNMLSISQQLVLTTASGGAQGSFLNFLPVTAASVPVSTAIGIVLDAPAGITNTHTVDDPQQVDRVVRLAQIGGAYPVFTVGSYVVVAATNYPEQTKLLAVVNHGDGTMTLTMKLRNPNTSAVIFQGGIAGQYLSFDANLAFSGLRSSYFAFGSLTGNDLIYGMQMAGGVAGLFLPQPDCEAAKSDGGASSGFHLYPGAEIVANNDQGFACTLEQNNVTWAVNDVVENPHYPVFGGTGLWVTRFQDTPSNGAFGQTGFALDVGGTGFGGGNVAMIRATNKNPQGYYQAAGGPLTAPVGLMLNGNFGTCIYIQRAPQGSGALILCDNPASDANPNVAIKALTVSSGNIWIDPASSTWRLENNVETGNLTVDTTLNVGGVANLLGGRFSYSGDNGTCTLTMVGSTAAGAAALHAIMRYEAVANTASIIAFDVTDDNGNNLSTPLALDTAGAHVTGGISVNGAPGVSGSYMSQDGKTVTVLNGLIIGIV